MIAIYCAEQLDGIASAAIVTRYARLKKLQSRFCGYVHHEKLTQQLKEMPKKEHIFVLDLCPKKEHLPQISQLPMMYWSTHDVDSPPVPAKIFDHTTQKRCSAELAQQRFLANDTTARKLAALAHSMTFWLKCEQAQQLTDLIASGCNAADLINSLSKGVTWSQSMQNRLDEYLAKKEEAYASLLKTLTIKKYLTHSFCYALATITLTAADAAQKILDSHQGIDATIILYKNGKINFRKRNECNVNLRKIAQLFDGGGQTYASGAHINQKITKESYEKTISMIDSRLKEFFCSNKQ